VASLNLENYQSEKSFSNAAVLAEQYPKYSSQIMAAARTSFPADDLAAYLAGIAAIMLGMALVFFMFPKKDEEQKLLDKYK